MGRSISIYCGEHLCEPEGERILGAGVAIAGLGQMQRQRGREQTSNKQQAHKDRWRRKYNRISCSRRSLRIRIQGIGLAQITRVTKLSNQIGGSHQQTLFIALVTRVSWYWKRSKFDGARNSLRVKEFTVRDPVHDIELGTINVIRHQRRVGGAARCSGRWTYSLRQRMSSCRSRRRTGPR